MATQRNIIWPPATYQEQQLEREIEQSRLDARRLAALNRREARRWWAKTLLVVALLAAAAWLVMWLASGQGLPLI